MPNSKAISALKFATSALIIAGGVVLMLASHPLSAFLPNLFIDLAFLPFDGIEKATEPAARLLAALAGGALVGFGITFWLIITQLMPREPELAKSIMTTSLLCWFAIDSSGSALAGAWFNIVMNLAILACFLVPLQFVKRDQMV